MQAHVERLEVALRGLTEQELLEFNDLVQESLRIASGAANVERCSRALGLHPRAVAAYLVLQGRELFLSALLGATAIAPTVGSEAIQALEIELLAAREFLARPSHG